MNKEQVGGKFDQLKGEIKKAWGKLTDDEVELYNGNATKFYGVLEEKYGVAKEAADKKIKEIQNWAADAEDDIENDAA